MNTRESFTSLLVYLLPRSFVVTSSNATLFDSLPTPRDPASSVSSGQEISPYLCCSSPFRGFGDDDLTSFANLLFLTLQIRSFCDLHKELAAEMENLEAPSARGVLQVR